MREDTSKVEDQQYREPLGFAYTVYVTIIGTLSSLLAWILVSMKLDRGRIKAGADEYSLMLSCVSGYCAVHTV